VSVLSIPYQAPPSLTTGYADSASVSRYPSLWQGMTRFFNFDVAPANGPSGANVRKSFFDLSSGSWISTADADAGGSTVVTSRGRAIYGASDNDWFSESATKVIPQTDQFSFLWCGFFPASGESDFKLNQTGSVYFIFMRTDQANGGFDLFVKDSAAALVVIQNGSTDGAWSSGDYFSHLITCDGSTLEWHSEFGIVSDAGLGAGFGAIAQTTQDMDWSVVNTLAFASWNRPLNQSEVNVVRRDFNAPFRRKSRIISIPAAAPAAADNPIQFMPF